MIFLDNWLIELGIALFVFFNAIFFKAINKPESQQWMYEFVEQEQGAKTYRKMVSGVLSFFDRRWDKQYWSPALYDFNLLCAALYPVGFVLLFWLLGSFSGELGELVLLEPTDWWRRLSFAVCLLLIFILFLCHKNTPLLTFLTIVCLSISVFVFVFDVTVSIAIFAAIIIFGGFARSGASLIMTVCLVGVSVINLEFEVLALAGVIFTLIVILDERLWRLTSQMSFLFLLTLFLFVVMIGSLWMIKLSHYISQEEFNTAISMLVFLGLLPLINALFDFFSYGLTRALLSKSMHKMGVWSLLWSVLDLLLACLLLLLLAATLLLMFQIVNALVGVPVLEPQAILAELRDNSQNYWWLYAVLLSTLLPTLLHFVIASFSFITLIPRHLWQILSIWMQGAEINHFKHWFAASGYAAGSTISIMLPIVSFYAVYHLIEFFMQERNLVFILRQLEKLIF